MVHSYPQFPTMDRSTPVCVCSYSQGWTPLSYARAKGKYGATEEKGIYPEVRYSTELQLTRTGRSQSDSAYSSATCSAPCSLTICSTARALHVAALHAHSTGAV